MMHQTSDTASLAAHQPGAAARKGGARLELAGIAASRAGRPVLADLSFAVEAGEIFGLLGPNGAGKTTAFHVLTGLLPSDRGAIRLDGAPLRPHDRAYRARIGVVFQTPALDPRLSATENLRFAACLYGLSSGTARKRASELLERAELTDRADEPIARLSGGMRRRIEIARALLHEPEILILDEPTSGLDEAAFRRTWAHLLDLRRTRGTTLLLITHRPDEAEYCDRIAILHDGRIAACDTPERLRARVSGDLVVLETADPDAIARAVHERLGIPARTVNGRVVLEHARGHELVPRIVEAFPEGTLSAVSVRRTGLGEVFLELTGKALDETRAGRAQ
jgi:ABC-2 type transport system ATP-binding protein